MGGIIRVCCVLVLSGYLVGATTIGERDTVSVHDFFGDFEGASLINPRQIGPNHFSLETQSIKVYGAQGRLGTWVCAGIRLDRVNIKGGESVRIVVPDGNKSAVLRAVYSFDRRDWQFVKTQRTSFDFDVPIERGRKAVYFATFIPYFYSQMIENNRLLARSKYVRFGSIGKSVHKRAIPVATITDWGIPQSMKKRAFIIGGTHGAETASIYGVEGVMNFLASEDPLAREMRRKVVWKVIPIHNVDAAAEGLDRRNAGGINLYFDWGFHAEEAEKLAKFKDDPSVSTRDFSQPETRAAYDAIVKFKPHVFLDVHSWHFSGDGFWGPDPAAKGPAIDQLKKSIAKYFKVQRWDHEGHLIASAPTIAKKLDIAATLPEFALSFDSDNSQKSTDSMRRQGVEILRGTFEYLESL